MKKLILVLSVALAMSLSACNGGGTVGPEEQSSSSSVEAVPSSVVDQSSSSSEAVIPGSSAMASSSSEVIIPVSSSSVVVNTYNYDSTVTNWKSKCPVEQSFGSTTLDSAATWRKIAEWYRTRPGVVLTGSGEEFILGHDASYAGFVMLLITTDSEIKQWLRLQDNNPVLECAVFQSRSTLLSLQAEGLTYQLINVAFYGP